MPSEAMDPMPPPKALTFTVSPNALTPAKVPTPVGTIDPKTGQPKRGRGRPPGSTKKVVTPPGGVNPPMTMRGSGPSGRQPKATDPVDDKEAIKAQKAARAEQYSTYINQELNDKLFMFLISASGGSIKADYIYKEGKVPLKAIGNPALTDFGNAIAIPPDVADSWGKLLAELSFTDVGKNITKATDNHSMGIIMAAITAVYSTYRYSQQLKPILDGIKAANEMKKAEANGTSSDQA